MRWPQGGIWAAILDVWRSSKHTGQFEWEDFSIHYIKKINQHTMKRNLNGKKKPKKLITERWNPIFFFPIQSALEKKQHKMYMLWKQFSNVFHHSSTVYFILFGGVGGGCYTNMSRIWWLLIFNFQSFTAYILKDHQEHLCLLHIFQ